MKYIKILICSLFVFMSTLAYSGQINPKDWVVFMKTYQTEQFHVNFPDDPEYFSTEEAGSSAKHFFANAAAEGTNYSLDIFTKREGDFLTEYLMTLQNRKDIEIIKSSFASSAMNECLDVVYIDHGKFLSYKTRAIVTKKNIYVLKTSYKPEEKENHSYFIRSFTVLG